ncbi:TetR/AcrR family transcriptional regulator [Arcanobacterium haemolyticum]|nr:TetR/AcrR family transcriptional regulator [Arcanobacterium haemolyticum]
MTRHNDNNFGGQAMPRQARTSDNLKERMANALLELLKAKPYADISVSEITDLADVGRATYYRHFTSKDDVLFYKFELIFGFKDFDHNPSHHPGLDEVRAYFVDYLEHLIENRDLLELIYQRDLDYLLFSYTYREAVTRSDAEGLVAKYRAAIHAAMVFAIIDQWIVSGFERGPREMADFLIYQVFPHGHPGKHENPDEAFKKAVAEREQELARLLNEPHEES